MAIFKPKSTGGGNKFLGVCEVSIESFKDRSGEFDWADLYLDVTVKPKESEYTRNIQIKGSFDKDSNGKIEGGSVLRRMYVFFEAIGCTAGLNVDGGWEDADGNEITDIAQYLNDNFTEAVIPGDEQSFDYLAYIYREKPKKPGDKSWTRVYHKIYKNAEGNTAKLQDDINWLKGKGIIKELDDTVSSETSMSEGALSNL
jgi:hypothetical protein|tara:strand:+ start:1466 stop:2065 length:600 start_codon:yes stop_codon:yes gene_type:complete